MKIEARAYAKINWLLDVGELRTDGYHELSTLFQTIDLYDNLYFESAPELSLEITGGKQLKADESNLVIRAARLLQSEQETRPGACIRLKKNIPMAAGLGGG